MVVTLSRKRRPFWEKLSVVTMAMGAAPATKRAWRSAATMPMEVLGSSGLAAISSVTSGRSLPEASVRP